MSEAGTKTDIVKLVAELNDGTFIVEHADGHLERQRDETDWARVDALTDEDIEAAMRDDPDWADLVDVDWSELEVVTPPRKEPVSIRLDEDVLEFFRHQGRGYQTRINAVLRSYVEARTGKRPPAKKRA